MYGMHACVYLYTCTVIVCLITLTKSLRFVICSLLYFVRVCVCGGTSLGSRLSCDIELVEKSRHAAIKKDIDKKEVEAYLTSPRRRSVVIDDERCVEIPIQMNPQLDASKLRSV